MSTVLRHHTRTASLNKANYDVAPVGTDGTGAAQGPAGPLCPAAQLRALENFSVFPRVSVLFVPRDRVPRTAGPWEAGLLLSLVLCQA